MRVYNQYVKNKPAVILSIVPEGAGDTIAAPDSWTMYERNIPESAPAEVNWSPPVDDLIAAKFRLPARTQRLKCRPFTRLSSVTAFLCLAR